MSSHKTPRVFVCRHGETEWSKTGKHTSRTQLSLTAAGKHRIEQTREALLGDNRLIDPSRLKAIYVSPLKRAQETLQLLGLESAAPHVTVKVCEDIREWDYGDYEGLTSEQIRKDRKSRGLDKERDWDIWQDGCEGGESPEDVSKRLNRVIKEIRELYHGPAMSGDGAGDVALIAHGHSLRSFVRLWIGKEIQDGPSMILEAGGIGTLSYEHNSLAEPAVNLGISLCY